MAPNLIPLQVAILDDDRLARLSVEQILGRDLRTEVSAAFDRPTTLLRWLENRQRWELPDVFVVDTEYDGEPGLADLLYLLRAAALDRPILLLSQYGAPEVIQVAGDASVAGLVLKKEIALAVATAVYLAYTDAPVYSAALDPLLERLATNPAVRAWWHAGRPLPRWQLPPTLSERQAEIAWHYLVYGMSARLAGEEISLAKRSVQKYTTHLYNKLEKLGTDWFDTDPLKPVLHRLHRTDPGNCDEEDGIIYTGEEWAFHLLTQLPRRH